MIFVSSARSGPQLIHEADVALQPICGQTNAEKNETWQRDLSGPVTCRKCLLLRAQLNDINATVGRASSRAEPSLPSLPSVKNLP